MNESKERLVDLIDYGCNEYASYSTETALSGNYGMEGMGEFIADKILADGWIKLPCKEGDTVYKIRKFCGKNTGYKEFYRPSKEFEKNCHYLEPQSWYDDCDKCKAVEDYDEGCYCDLNVKIFCDTCKDRIAIQKDKFTLSMLHSVFNTPMFNENTKLEDTYFLTKEEAEQALRKDEGK